MPRTDVDDAIAQQLQQYGDILDTAVSRVRSDEVTGVRVAEMLTADVRRRSPDAAWLAIAAAIIVVTAAIVWDRRDLPSQQFVSSSSTSSTSAPNLSPVKFRILRPDPRPLGGYGSLNIEIVVATRLDQLEPLFEDSIERDPSRAGQPTADEIVIGFPSVCGREPTPASISHLGDAIRIDVLYAEPPGKSCVNSSRFHLTAIAVKRSELRDGMNLIRVLSASADPKATPPAPFDTSIDLSVPDAYTVLTSNVAKPGCYFDLDAAAVYQFGIRPRVVSSAEDGGHPAVDADAFPPGVPHPSTAASFDGATNPGQPGVAIVVGAAYSSPSGPGPFQSLSKLRPGSTVKLSIGTGCDLIWQVTHIRKHTRGSGITNLPEDGFRPRLRLLGQLPDQSTDDQELVVEAELIQAIPGG